MAGGVIAAIDTVAPEPPLSRTAPRFVRILPPYGAHAALATISRGEKKAAAERCSARRLSGRSAMRF